MYIFLEKTDGTNKWDFPDSRKYFKRYMGEQVFNDKYIVEYLGTRTLEELTEAVDYTVVEFTEPQVPDDPIPRNHTTNDVLLRFPDDAITDLDTLAKDTGATKDDRGKAMKLLALLTSGEAVNVNETRVDALLQWALVLPTFEPRDLQVILDDLS